jgi:hemolysin activation/secretion protein
MSTLITISRKLTRPEQPGVMGGALLVIIATGIFGLTAMPAAADTHSLTTASAPAPAATLTTVIVSGSTIFSVPQLFGVYRDQLGKPISRDGARAITAALAELYQLAGYVKPELKLDDSLAAQGVLRVQVNEAQITNVVFEGDMGRYRDALERIAGKLEAARPLRRDDVAQALRSMRAIAGLAVTATTRRDAVAPNSFELVVKSDFSPVEGIVRMNNRGTDQVGPAFLLGQLFANGLLGHEEKIGLIFAAATDTDEYLGGGLYVDTPLGTSGTRGNALLFHSDSAPNEAPVNLTDEYIRERATFKVSRPLRQDATLSLSMSGGLEADNLTIDRDGTSSREDRLRIAELALRASWRGTISGTTQYSLSTQLRQGLDALGAGLHAADLIDDQRSVDFLVMQLQGTSYRRFAERWSVRLDGFAQYSNDVLPDSERFKIGGDRLGRGFEVTEIAGDRGIGAKLELRRELVNTESFMGRLSAYGFYDFGAAWKQDIPGRESAATAGTGVAIAGAALTGYLEIAAPLTGPDIEGSHDTSVFAELSYRF